MEPDYQNYSLEELEEIRSSIDNIKYADRFALVCNLIEEKRASPIKSEQDKTYIEEIKGLDSRKGCEKIIFYGVVSGLIVTILELSKVVIGLFHTYEDEYLQPYNDPFVIFGVALLAILTFYIYKKSRIGSTLMFSIYLFENLNLWLLELQPKGIILGAILIVIFFNTMKATFKWHSKYQDSHLPET